MKNEHRGIRRIISAAHFSLAGLKATFKSEEAFRQEIFATIVLLPVAFYIADSPLEFSLLMASLLLLMIVELLNTGIEIVVDRIGHEFHELSGKAKDAGSAAVFLSLALVILVWIGIAI